MITSAASPELASADFLAQFLSRFESGEIPSAEWTHSAHIAAAGGLLLSSTPDLVLPRVRSGILRLLAFNKIETTLTRGYHESVTRLWVYTCNAFLRESRLAPLDSLRSLIAVYGHRNTLHREFYSFDVLTSSDARSGWVPPDLQPLPAAWRSGRHLISCNPKLLNIARIHEFLKESYWAKGIPRGIVERATRNSLPFGVYEDDAQIGFARVVTDFATYGYLADVFIAEPHRGQGLSKWLVGCILEHPSLQEFRRWQLATRDAHSLYRQFGFREVADPSRLMEIVRADIY